VKLRHDKIAVFVARASGDGRSHEFLQLHRSADDWAGGTWQTVRGTIEPNETAIQAALRELREETTLVPGEFYRLDSIETFYSADDDSIVHSIPFLAFVDPPALVMLNAEHDAMRWVAEDDADQAFMWPSEMPLLSEIRRYFLVDTPCKRMLLIRP
jgi:dATP pyrophosphohydrolase